MKNARTTMAALVALTSGCLPRGEPPEGRQIVADRTATLVGLLPPTGDGVLRAFFTRPIAQNAEGPEGDLFEVSVEPTGGPPVERLLVPSVDATLGLGCGFDVSPCRGIDAGGVTVSTESDGYDVGDVRADAITGDLVQLMGLQLLLSQDRRRFSLSNPSSQPPAVTLYDVDGQTTMLDDASPAQFIANDFFYFTSEGVLMDVPPSGVPQQVATGLDPCTTPSTVPGQLCQQFWGQATPDGIALVLHMATPGPNGELWAVRDPITGTQSWLPFDASLAGLSPDGRWFLTAESSGGSNAEYTLFDYRAGLQQTADLPVPLNTLPGAFALVFTAHWRPGTDQVWVRSGTDTVILEPNKPPASIPGRAVGGFTPDGAFWYSTSTLSQADSLVEQVGSADNPSGPRFDLNTPGEDIDPVSQFADGTLLVPVYTDISDEQTRGDVSVLDPRTGASRLLGQRGRIAAVGQTRVMGMFHWDEMRGDLTVADPATAQATVLAPEFTVTAFAEPQGADQLAPGTRIVYQFQARTDSPYDGIWMATAP
ncbi:MAG TPA: hypothetical protein VMT03_15140 [Polyangia bacterium]|nr:hypothetical protein [Polyangia bacterium]